MGRRLRLKTIVYRQKLTYKGWVVTTKKLRVPKKVTDLGFGGQDYKPKITDINYRTMGRWLQLKSSITNKNYLTMCRWSRTKKVRLPTKTTLPCGSGHD